MAMQLHVAGVTAVHMCEHVRECGKKPVIEMHPRLYVHVCICMCIVYIVCIFFNLLLVHYYGKKV